MQSGNGCTLDEDGNSGNGNKWSGSKYILEVEPTDLLTSYMWNMGESEKSWVTSGFYI